MSIYDIEVRTVNGEMVKMEAYKGKVVMIVNTASKCGFTPQFEALEALYKTYHNRGFEILGFPCNQFGNQDPGTIAEITQFCSLNYGVTFTMFDKIEVNGEGEHPLYAYLKEQQGGVLGDQIKWNFTKFLVDREGNVTGRYAPMTAPKQIEKDIENLL